MTTTVRDLSISVRTESSYQQVVNNLREALKSQALEILCELPVDRELDRKVGLRCEHQGREWQHYTVFVVWSPFDAYQALLSDRDGGLLVPFNVCVGEDGSSTFVAVSNFHGVLNAKDAPIGIQVLARHLARKIRQVLAGLDHEESRCAQGEVLANGTHHR
jgi:uncharacterized protein (DUF302 family)